MRLISLRLFVDLVQKIMKHRLITTINSTFMKRIFLLLFVALVSTARGQQVLLESGQRRPVGDSASVSFAIAAWGDSFTQSAGAAPDSTYPYLLQQSSGYFTFRGGVGGENSSQIKTRFLADKSMRTWNVILWCNNIIDSATHVNDIRQMVDSLQHDRYMILSVMNGTAQTAGTTAYRTIVNINRALDSLFKDHYLDVRSWLVSQFNPDSTQDVIDHGNDVPPRSLRYDGLHLNSKGYQKVAEYVYGHFEQLVRKKIIAANSLRSFVKRPLLNTDNNNLFTGRVFGMKDGYIGLKVNKYSHGINIGSNVGSAIRFNNSADDSTNQEYFELDWINNEFNLRSVATGTGTSTRKILITTQAGSLTVGPAAATGAVGVFRNMGGGNNSNFGIAGSHNQGAGFSNGAAILNQVNVSGTASYRALWISPYYTSSGTGRRLLIDAGLNGDVNGLGLHTSKFIVDSAGFVYANKMFLGGVTTPATALLHLSGGTATAETAPLKFSTGTLTSTPENGTVEYDGNAFYATPKDAIRGKISVVRSTTNSAASFTVSPLYKYQSQTGSLASTWTMATIAGNSDAEIVIINKSSQNITLNSSSGANDFWENGTVSNSKTIPAGSILKVFNDGSSWVIL